MGGEHTPGDWCVHPTDDTLVRRGRTSIAAAYSVDGDWKVAADARLIASAPDLLTALAALLSYDEQDAGCVPTDAHLDAQNDARAAIAKATTAAEAGAVGTERSEVDQTILPQTEKGS